MRPTISATARCIWCCGRPCAFLAHRPYKRPATMVNYGKKCGSEKSSFQMNESAFGTNRYDDEKLLILIYTFKYNCRSLPKHILYSVQITLQAGEWITSNRTAPQQCCTFHFSFNEILCVCFFPVAKKKLVVVVVRLWLPEWSVSLGRIWV